MVFGHLPSRPTGQDLKNSPQLGQDPATIEGTKWLTKRCLRDG